MKYDYLIVGSGLSGLFLPIERKERGRSAL